MNDKLSTQPFLNSKKIFINGEIHDIQVAMREIELVDLKKNNPDNEETSLITYDTSGPFSDPNAEINIREGLPRLRDKWLQKNDDIEELSDFSSVYCKERLQDKSLNEFRFPKNIKPLKAKPDKDISQLYYAKKGVITPEMEYVAL